MRNHIIEGIKRHGASNFFLELKERVAGGWALTAREWEWYRARQREWEPEVLAAEMADDANGVAARIEALEAEIERLRKALKEITWDGPIWRAQRIAREALGIELPHVNQQTRRDDCA